MNTVRWMAWQTRTLRGHSRWTVNHATLDGEKMLCGVVKPELELLQRDDLIGPMNCPKCGRLLAKRRAGGTT